MHYKPTYKELKAELDKLKKQVHVLQSNFDLQIDTNDKLTEKLIKANKELPFQKGTKRNQMFFNFFNVSPDIMVISDINGVFKVVNPATTKLLGYSEDELLLKPFIDFVHPDDKQKTLDEAQRNTTGYTLNFENRYKRKDGSYIVLSWCSYYNKKEEITYATARDVSNERMIEAELYKAKVKAEESEEKYRNIIENALVGVFETDVEGNLLFVNNHLIEKSGYKNLEELKSKNASESYFIPTQRDTIINRLKKEGAISNLEIDFLDANNEVVHCLLNMQLSNNNILGLLLDITHRKKAEEELIKLSRAVEQSPISIIITDLDGAIEYANPKVTDITGYQPSELIGQNPRILSSGKMDEQDYSKLWQTISKGNKWYGEFLNKKKNGELFWENASISPIFDAEGKIMHYLAVKEDITKQKELIHDLKEIKNKALEGQKSYKALFDTIGDAIYIQDYNGEFLDVNKGVLDMYGYAKEELIGNTPIFLIAPDKNDMSVFSKLFEKVKQGTPHVFEFWGKRKNGEIFPKLVSQYKGTYFGRDVVITVSKDITERKQAENALKDSELRFKALHNASFGGIAIHDSGIILDCNQGLSDVTGYAIDELIGMNGLMLIAQKSRKQVMNNIKTGYEKPYEAFGLRKNGEEYPIRLEARTIPFKGKQVRSVEFRDITKEKQTEIELIKAKEQAEESDRLKSAFLANMSHEIRTPMNGILGFAGLLKTPELTGENQQKYIDIIEKSGERMLNIINDIVSISKIESGLMSINLEETNFNEQVEFIYNFFKPEVESKNLQFLLKESISFSEAIIYTDREKVFAILTNLVKNAIKFTEKGFIELGYFKKDNFLQFYIKDSGIGVPKDRQEAIFERFIQADIYDKNAKQGAGLGLSITKAYIELLGGDLWVASDKGKGSTFYFRLPCQTAKVTEEIEKIEILNHTDINPTKMLKILIVDDDQSSEVLLSIALEEFAKEIVVARNGIEAVEMCRKHTDIDLILMDIQMPEMDGYEATKQIRKFNSQVYIIAQTAYALAGDKEKVLDVGCNDYITKPIKMDELHELISIYLLIK